MNAFADNGLTLSYATYGHGPAVILAFHGFGRTGRDFHVFEEALDDRFTIHAFDLPFHGESDAPPERAEQPFTPEELSAFFRAFADQLRCEKVLLMGYSLGGRLVLSLLTTMPDRVAHAVLIAPDGLKHRPWYRALAASAWGRRRYARFLEEPGRVQGIIHIARRIRLISEKLHRFLIGQIGTREQRRLVHDVWLSFRLVEPDLGAVAEALHKHRIGLELLLGTYDQVIKPRFGKALQGRAPERVRTHLLPAGHTLLTPATAARLREVLNGISS